MIRFGDDDRHNRFYLTRTTIYWWIVIGNSANPPDSSNSGDRFARFPYHNTPNLIRSSSLPSVATFRCSTLHILRVHCWMMSMPPAPTGCPYLNFTASHDGIGMRLAEELLSEQEQTQIVDAVIRFGGRVSTRRSTDGGECVYQIDRDKDEKMVEAEYVWMRSIFYNVQNAVVAIKLGGRGDVTDTHVVWR